MQNSYGSPYPVQHGREYWVDHQGGNHARGCTPTAQNEWHNNRMSFNLVMLAGRARCQRKSGTHASVSAGYVRHVRGEHVSFFGITAELLPPLNNFLAISCPFPRSGGFPVASNFKVSLGNMFRGQTGHVWTKGVALMTEVDNSARDEKGDPLPVVVSMRKRHAT